MSHPLEPSACFLFYSIIYSKDKFHLNNIVRHLKLDFSKLAILSPCFNPLSSYYSKEMGDKNLLNRIIIFDQRLDKKENIVKAKLHAYEIEKTFATNTGARIVNIDPGYVSLENCILSTFKPYSHRIYLSQGVWAEPNYYFEQGSFKEFPWTYPDYRHLEKVASFNTQRSILKSLI